MKNKISSLAAIAVLTLSISGCSIKQEVKEVENKDICPVLNIENTTQEQRDLAKGLTESLELFLSVKEIYFDVLKKYNKTENIDKYINKNGLKEFSTTEIFETLIAMKTLATPGHYGNEKSEKFYQEAYQEVLNSVDGNNPNWCEAKSYKHITDKYTKLVEELKRKK